MSSDYDTDIVLWSEHQADLLRRLAAGERVNDQLDLAHIIEEIEDVGQSERRELSSRIATVIEHLIRLQASPPPAHALDGRRRSSGRAARSRMC